mmetsp:Transcript_13400/g.19321  ORF Transcript_13400/g.19321 Transcript_13400/m.19321 type:complete len:101 (-) Transcript_13400:267-569(-)
MHCPAGRKQQVQPSAEAAREHWRGWEDHDVTGAFRYILKGLNRRDTREVAAVAVAKDFCRGRLEALTELDSKGSVEAAPGLRTDHSKANQTVCDVHSCSS